MEDLEKGRKSINSKDMNPLHNKSQSKLFPLFLISTFFLTFVLTINPTDTIKWGFANIDPVWSGITANEFRIEYG